MENFTNNIKRITHTKKKDTNELFDNQEFKTKQLCHLIQSR